MRFTSWGCATAVVAGLSISYWSPVEAAAPGPSHKSKNHAVTVAVTVTEVETEAELADPAGVSNAKGHAEYHSVTKTDATGAVVGSATFLSIGVKHLSLADGSTVSYTVAGAALVDGNGNAVTATVKNGRAFLRLSTKKGSVVPTVNTGDAVTVVDASGNVLVSGAFGAGETETESGH